MWRPLEQVRLMKYVRRDPLEQPNDAVYYNEPDLGKMALDVTKVESRR